ncbi:hypothetical protein F4677DRAFT_353153 [Hypoxylon crocopeplum]|nr:hypothetical protein F4677DRAFT_353153 [Hypoxylon crocopeplum]
MKVLSVGLIAALASLVGAAVIEKVAATNAPHWPPHPTSSSVVVPSTTSSFTFIITTLPGHSTTSSAALACPTVTHTTRPSGCDPMLCPVPGCTFQQDLIVPCGCAGVKTALFVDGCQTACPTGCITRLSTISAVCATATPAPVAA